GQGENELAVVRASGGGQRPMEPQHAELLRPRSPGGDPAQVGRRPRRTSHRHGAGETDQRGGSEQETVAVGWPAPVRFSAAPGRQSLPPLARKSVPDFAPRGPTPHAPRPTATPVPYRRPPVLTPFHGST